MSISPASSASPIPVAASIPPGGSAAPIDPKLAAMIQSLPPDQQQAALAKISSMSAAEQQQLVAQIAAKQQDAQQPATSAASTGASQAQAGSAAIHPQLTALIQSLPPEQQQAALAKISAMTPEQQQQLVAQIAAKQAGDSTGTAATSQAEAGAEAARPESIEPALARAKPALRTYAVKSGDNLSVIAARYGLTWQQLYHANRGRVGDNPNLIHPGLKLKIPRR